VNTVMNIFVPQMARNFLTYVASQEGLQAEEFVSLVSLCFSVWGMLSIALLGLLSLRNT
jgi:hypothetical protein